MYDSTRDVSGQEIFNSYRGILRISPNYILDAEIDDTESLYDLNSEYYNIQSANTNSPDNTENKIYLSDSDGNIFDIYFYPKTFKCIVNDSISINGRETDLINIVHYYNILRINKSLNLYSTLSCKKLSVIDGDYILKYPLDAPVDSEYCNKNDKLGIGQDKSIKNVEEKFSLDNIVNLLRDSGYTQVKVDNEPIWRKSVTGATIPEVYRHDYILGHSKNATYLDENGKTTTELSFLSLDNLIWEKVSAVINGLAGNRHYIGRYTQLGKDGNESISSKIFDASSTDVSNAAPIIGTPVQSGIIMQSAMPITRYFFYLKNIDSEQLDSYVYNLIKEYALCDGRRLKYWDANSRSYKSDYPISMSSKNWNSFDFNTNSNNVYSVISLSMPDYNASSKILYTPKLFENDQLSPRYLRGLNWKSGSPGVQNTKVHKISPDNISDTANVIKNINQVGPYLANHDYKIRNLLTHQHHCLVNQSALPTSDTLYNDSKWHSR